MFSATPNPIIIVLGAAVDDNVIDCLKPLFPKAIFRRLTLDELKEHNGIVNGAIIFGERMLPSEINECCHRLHSKSLPVLFVQGEGGLNGIKSLFRHHNLTILPQYWTLEILREIVLSDTKKSTSNNTFLDGLVENLRDPLTSISGYLQLLRSKNSDESYLQPALKATRDLDNTLEILHLISPQRNPHITRLSLQAILEDLCKQARRSGIESRPPTAPVLEVQADGRLVQAALTVALQYLLKFGGPGDPKLKLKEDKDSLSIFWEINEPSENHNNEPPPFFHEHLIECLAKKLKSIPYLKHDKNRVPLEAGIRLKYQRTEK